MLDYGGADGKFLPNLGGAKYVFEVSDIRQLKGLSKLKILNPWALILTSNSLMS